MTVVAIATACGGDDDGGGADGGGSGADAGAADAAGPANVTIHTYDGPFASDVPLLAYQDGDAAWQRVDGGGGSYTFTVESGRYAVAVVCDLRLSNGQAHVRTVRLLTGDATELAFACPWHERTASFTGSVSGLAAGENAGMNLGTALTSANFAEPDYSAMVMSGTVDLLALRYASTTALLRMIIERDFQVTDGGSRNFDLGADGFAPAVRDLEVTGLLEGETSSMDNGFFTGTGQYAYLGYIDETHWAGVPAAELEPDDGHVVSVHAGIEDDGTYRQAFSFLRDPVDISLALPAPGDDPTVTVGDTSPYVRMHYEPARASGHRLYELEFRLADGPEAFWRDAASSGWLDAGYSIDTPDLSAVEGWNPDWEIPAGMTLYLVGRSYATDGSVAQVLDALALIDPPDSYTGAPVTGLDGLAFTRTRWADQVLP